MRATVFTALATTGGTINWPLVVGAGVLLLLGIGAIVFTRLRRKPPETGAPAEDDTKR